MAPSQPTALVVDRAHHTSTPDWVRVSGVSVGAKEVYNQLVMFAETYAGQHRDEPVAAQAMLAEVLGMSQSWVSARVKELRELGAVETRPFKGPGGGLIYAIRKNPPEGYAGPKSLVEYFERRAANGAVDKRTEATDANGAPTNDANVPPAAAANVGRKRSANVPAAAAANVRPTNGETFAGTKGATQTANAGDVEHPELAPILDAAEAHGMAAEDPAALRKLRAKLVPLLAAGVRPQELHHAVVGNLGGAGKKIAVALANLNDLKARADRARSHPAPAPSGPMCDKGGAHNQYRADNCKECKIEEIEEIRQRAPKNTDAVYGTAFAHARR